MTAAPHRTLRLRKLLFVSLLLLICLSVSIAIYQHNQQWVVPESARQLKNPLQRSESNLHSAYLIYQQDCANCHGTAGKGDGPESKLHDPLPADLTNPKTTATLTDGEIFYQITEGRRPMPSFKRRLTEDQRWQLVLLVRSFSTPTPAKFPPATKLVQSSK
jgi:mono/diheme cytochrome c family protein